MLPTQNILGTTQPSLGLEGSNEKSQISAIGSSVLKAKESESKQAFSIFEADKKDCDGILDVLQFNRSRFADQTSQTKPKTGFLVYPFNKEELEGWIKDKVNYKILVAKNGSGKVLGYTLGYLLKKEKFSEYEKTSAYPILNGQFVKVFYLRHIAVGRKTETESNVGKALLENLTSKLEEDKFTHILDEICEGPIVNQRSVDFHSKNHFIRKGSVCGSDKIVWGVYMRVLSPKL